MRVLEISTARIWGGGEGHLRALCFGLLRRGHEVMVACRRESPASQILNGDGLRVIPIPEDRNVRALACLAVAEKIDLIHAHQSKGAQLAVAARYLAGRPRAILTRHALGLPDGDLPRAGLARIIAVSQAVARDCLSAGFDPRKVAIAPNGIELEHFRPGFPAASRERLGLPPEAKLVAIPGRLGPDKGVVPAVEALRPLLAQTGLHLLILGDGEERPRLERLIRRSGLDGKVSLLGHQPDVRPFLALAHAVLVPGPQEAFGLAVLEAMAMGCAVVAMDAGGVPELIEDGREGLLVPPGDAMALAAAVYRLTCDGPLRKRLGAAARQRAMEFSTARMVEKTEVILADVVLPPAQGLPGLGPMAPEDYRESQTSRGSRPSGQSNGGHREHCQDGNSRGE